MGRVAELEIHLTLCHKREVAAATDGCIAAGKHAARQRVPSTGGRRATARRRAGRFRSRIDQDDKLRRLCCASRVEVSITQIK